MDSVYPPEILTPPIAPLTVIAQIDPATAKKTAIRAKIYEAAGDPESLLGTTSDVAAAALIGVAHLIVLLSQKGSAEVKAGISASPIPVKLAQDFLAGVSDGSIQAPLLIKGVESVFEEMIQRATATAKALS